VVVQGGKRLLAFRSARAAIFIVDWNIAGNTLVSTQFQQIAL
jgi:hypothetical protein